MYRVCTFLGSNGFTLFPYCKQLVFVKSKGYVFQMTLLKTSKQRSAFSPLWRRIILYLTQIIVTILGHALLGPTIFSWLGLFVFYWGKPNFGCCCRCFSTSRKLRSKGQSRAQSPQGLCSAVSRQDRLWGTGTGDWNFMKQMCSVRWHSKANGENWRSSDKAMNVGIFR